MLPKQLISSFVSALNSRIPPPVHTAGIENERPVPAVLVKNVQLENKNFHNSNYAGSEYNNSGQETTQIFRHYYSLRLELLVRDDDEVQAFDYLGQLKQALSELSRDPCDTIHNDVNDLKDLGSSGVSYQFYEPTETEINQTVVLETFYDSKATDLDVIENIPETYNFS